MPLGAFRIKRNAWFDSGSGRRLRGNDRIQRNAWFDSDDGCLIRQFDGEWFFSR